MRSLLAGVLAALALVPPTAAQRPALSISVLDLKVIKVGVGQD